MATKPSQVFDKIRAPEITRGRYRMICLLIDWNTDFAGSLDEPDKNLVVKFGGRLLVAA